MSEDRFSNRDLSLAKRLVVKIGSALVADDSAPRQAWLNALADDIAALQGSGVQVVLVSSGAVALGRALLGDNRPKKLREKQAAAALGQPLLVSALQTAFEPHGVPVAQSLLTLEDTENRRRWLNARATLNTLLEAGALPLINENDTVATDEIRYGDNDRLAARVAQMISADVLVLLSDVDGLYTADPTQNPDAAHLAVVSELTPEVMAMGGEANADADVGSGGMVTKLAAAQIAWASGCATVITLGNRDRPLTGLNQEGARATWIVPPVTPDKAREVWLQSLLAPEGCIHIDAGAVSALRAGKSLLPVGAVRIEGLFERGAAVAVKGPTGATVAKGLVAYSSEDAAAICGLQSDEVTREIGYKGRPALIHRDDLVQISEYNG